MTAGRAEPGWIVCGATPGMLKVVVSVPALAFAELMASRKLQWVTSHVPSSISSVELTAKEVRAETEPWDATSDTATEARTTRILRIASWIAHHGGLFSGDRLEPSEVGSGVQTLRACNWDSTQSKAPTNTIHMQTCGKWTKST